MDNKLKTEETLQNTTSPESGKAEQPSVSSGGARQTFTVSNQALNKALKVLSGVVDHSQVIQILGYLKCSIHNQKLSLIASNSEIETHISIPVSASEHIQEQSFTLPCRKLFDITRTVDSDADLTISPKDSWSEVTVAKTRFKLASLPANSFPQLTKCAPDRSIRVSQNDLLLLLNRTSFAMASQDVRFFLNGMLISLTKDKMHAVATDGHRLSLNALDQSGFSDITPVSPEKSDDAVHFIVPRKTIQELRKHLQETDAPVEIAIGNQHMSVVSDEIAIYSNLIDGKYPNYQKLIPRDFKHQVVVSTDALRHSISKMAILANEKFHGARFFFEQDKLTISTHNVNHEEAVDELPITLSGEPIRIGFNLMYLVDILSVVATETIRINMVDIKSSVSFEEVDGNQDSLFIVMPLSI